MSDDLKLDIYFPQFASFLLEGKDAPAFAKLCALAEWQVNVGYPVEASLCKQFDIKKQSDWPLAPLALMGEGVEQEAGYWFLVHPVHFVLQRDFFTMGDALRLAKDEMETLALHLNQHFTQDKLRFVPSKSGEFLYMHVSDDVDVTTYLLSEVMGRDIGKYMPSGPHGMRLQSFLNEVQMLLHDHPINVAREQQGLLPVNSLWLSGGGSFQAMSLPAQKTDFQFFANDAVSRGLAEWAGIAYEPLASDYLSFGSNNGDAVLVMDKLKALENLWFKPLLKALGSGKIKTLRCHFDVHGMTFTLFAKSRDTWKFWRKTKSITTYFNLANA